MEISKKTLNILANPLTLIARKMSKRQAWTKDKSDVFLKGVTYSIVRPQLGRSLLAL